MTPNEQDLPEWAKHITLHGLAVSIDMDTTNRLVKALRHSQEQVAKLREALEKIKTGDCVPWVIAGEALEQRNES